MTCPRCAQIELAVQAWMAAKRAPMLRVGVAALGVLVCVVEPPTAGCAGCGVAVELPPEKPRHLRLINGGRA